MHVAYIGNFKPEFSTENEIYDAMSRLDWRVTEIQEGSGAIDRLLMLLQSSDRPDFILWTRTRDLADKWGHALQWKMLRMTDRAMVPVVGYHLDRFWGLKRNGREAQIWEEPYFQVDMLVTADGGHQEQWEEAHVNHRWLPPGVSERWCRPGEFREELASDIVFVGSWDGGYHREWRHRAELVAWLQRTYGDRVTFYPKRGEHAVRGLALNDVYWSAKVVIGDSCLAPKPDGSPMTHYCSDRIPETLGRGGILAHPSVDGIDDLFFHLRFPLGDWPELKEVIDEAVECHPVLNRLALIDHVTEHHTYTVRMQQLEQLLIHEGLL